MDTEQKFDIKKIKLIVGLGNTGREYLNTRHNIGFKFIETLAGNSQFNEEKKLKAKLFTLELGANKIILAEPTTMMNSSGESVGLISSYYNLKHEELLIVHDDLDIAIGAYKIQFGKGPKIHNGILSIENRLGTNKFWRLRLGVDNRTSSERDFFSGADYVLSRFKASETDLVSKYTNSIVEGWKLELMS